MNIRLFTEKDKMQWNQYVLKSNDSCCYHLLDWRTVIERSFAHKTYYLLAEDGEYKIRGILPLVHLKSMLFGNFMVSLPYFNYGGICADDEEIFGELAKEAVNIAMYKNASHIEYRHLHNNNLPVKKAKVSMRLAIPQNSEDLWKNISSKLRSQIRRPEKEGMYIREGMENELDTFYHVFSKNMRDLGTPVYAKKLFRNILEVFPDSSRIISVYAKDGSPAAAGFVVGFKNMLEIPWASSVKSYNRFSPNMMLYWNVLKFACENKYSFFDFGRSTPDEGTYKFKEQWGAKPVQLYWHYWMKNGEPLPELNPKNPKYQMAIKIWQKLPVVLTRIIGPAIVKNLP